MKSYSVLELPNMLLTKYRKWWK